MNVAVLAKTLVTENHDSQMCLLYDIQLAGTEDTFVITILHGDQNNDHNGSYNLKVFK